jgi:hypothetical protein
VSERLGTGIELGFYRLLSAGGGFTLEAPDKTVNYSKTPVSARYAFTFWAFPVVVIISLDPIHAVGEAEPAAWADFLKAFNEWAHQRGGIPLLNQSPFVTKAQVESAYGDRWTKLAGWLRTVDPDRRMVNEFFAELLP